VNVEKSSVCPLDCPDTCSLAVTVAGDQVVRVRGSKVNPITHGTVCAKVANHYPAFVHGPNRLRHPLRRVGVKGAAEFERISWDEALDIIHGRVSQIIDRYGPQALLPLNYAGPHGMLAGDSMSLRFFHRIGASLLSRTPLCGGIRSAAYAGTFGATPARRSNRSVSRSSSSFGATMRRAAICISCGRSTPPSAMARGWW